MINVSSDIKNEVMAKVEEVLNLWRAKYPGTNLPTPTVKFKQSGRRAGVCYFNHFTKECTITINPDYFHNHHDDMINRTVPHEVAHYVSDMVYGRLGRGHGPHWKSVMRAIGLKPDRCHTYSLEGVKTRSVAKPFKYICGCAEPNMVTLRIHTKIQERGAKYTCRKCRKKIVYYRQVNQTPAPVPTPEPIGVTTFTVGKVVVASFPTPDPFIIPVPPTPAPTPTPAPVTPAVTYKVVTKFVNGSLQNVRVPVEA